MDKKMRAILARSLITGLVATVVYAIMWHYMYGRIDWVGVTLFGLIFFTGFTAIRLKFGDKLDKKVA